MNLLMGAALVAVSAAVGIVLASLVAAAGRRRAYEEGCRTGLEIAQSAEDEEGFVLGPEDRGY